MLGCARLVIMRTGEGEGTGGRGRAIQELIDGLVVVKQVEEDAAAEGEDDGCGDESLKKAGSAEDLGAHCGARSMSGWWVD